MCKSMHRTRDSTTRETASDGAPIMMSSHHLGFSALGILWKFPTDSVLKSLVLIIKFTFSTASRYTFSPLRYWQFSMLKYHDMVKGIGIYFKSVFFFEIGILILPPDCIIVTLASKEICGTWGAHLFIIPTSELHLDTGTRESFLVFTSK